LSHKQQQKEPQTTLPPENHIKHTKTTEALRKKQTHTPNHHHPSNNIKTTKAKPTKDTGNHPKPQKAKQLKTH